MGLHCNLLLIEDLEADFLLLQRHLRQHGCEGRLERVASHAALEAALADGGWGAVLSDYNVPGLPFREGLALVRRMRPDLPVILVSGSVGEEEAVELLKLGLSDFVLKDRIARLVPAIERALREAADERARAATAVALRDSEARHRMALEAAGLGTWRHLAATGAMEMDLRCREHFDIDGEATTLAGSIARLHADDRERVTTFIDKLLRTGDDGASHALEARIVCRDGTVRWLAVTARVRHEEIGGRRRAVQAIGTTQDITARKRAEAELHERLELQDRLARVAMTVPGVIYSFRLAPDGRMSIPYASTAMNGVFELDGEALRTDASSFFERVHPDDRQWMRDGVARSAATMNPWRGEFRIVGTDGTETWIEAHSVPQREPDGGILWHGFAQSVTERHRAEAQLRESETRWQFALEGSDQGVWDWNAKTGAAFFSPRWKSMLGYAEHEIGARLEEWSDRVHPEDLPDAMAALRRHFAGETSIYEHEQRLRCRDGSYRWILNRGKVIEWTTDGEPLRIIGTHTDVTPRKAMESALRESEARANLILETAPEAILLVSADSLIVRANQRAYDVFGFPPGTLEGENVERLIPERLRTGHRRLHENFLADPRPRPMGSGRELPALRHDGTEFPAEISLGALHFGGVLHVIVTALDITARRAAEAALRESEQTLASAQAMARLGSWRGDFATSQVMPSAELARILGIPLAPCPSARMFALVHPDDGAMVRDAWIEALHGAPYDLEHRAIIDGEVKWLHVKARLDFGPDGRAVSVVGMTQDVTEVREAQAALETHRQHLEKLVGARTAELRQQASYLYALIDNMPFQVWLKDTASRYLAVNRANAHARGLAVDAMIGRTDAELRLGDDTPGADEDAAARAARRPMTGEHSIRGPRGQTWVETYHAPVFDPEGAVIGTVGFARDITDRKQDEAAREAALTEAHRLARARSEFLANMSHEIRTPLNAVVGLAQVGARQSADERARRTFGRILESGQLLLGIVDDVLDFSKIEAGKLELEQGRVPLDELIDRVVDLMAPRLHAKGLDFRVEESPGTPAVVDGDALRLTQVLVNLLSNAVKFTERGSVTLSIGREDRWLCFGVVDTGIGMTPAQVDRLFQPFEQADGSTTRRFGGTGLGLAICRRLVDLMGGRIHVDTRFGQGSRFEVRLPAGGATDREGANITRVAVVGLPAAEIEALAAQLSRWHIGLEVTEPGGVATTRAEVVLVDGARIGDVAPARGIIAVVHAPGEPAGGVAHSGFAVLERPLRVHRILALGHPAPVRDRTIPPGGPRLSGIRILAAEDNETNRLVLEELLGLEGAELVLVENGRQAVERLQADGADRYDLVITDIQMPEMDGYEATRRMHDLAPGLPVLGLTAHAMAEERQRCLQAGMVEHLAKPVDIEQLVAVVRRHAGRAPLARRQPGVESSPTRARVAAIDWPALMARFKGRRAFVDKLVTTVRTSHAETPRQLRDACSRQDLDALNFMAHSLKGMGGNLMARELHELAARTELAARERRTETMELAGRLADVLDEVLAALAAGGR